MDPKPLKSKRRPEDVIRDDIKEFLEARGWYVKTTHGGMFQSGFPDIYATHTKFGPRWIEVKMPDMKGSKWTKAQMECFPEFSKNGTPIWVMTAATEAEYSRLFGPENWFAMMNMNG